MISGGLKGGQTIGATNSKAEHPVKRALKPHDLLATIYHVLGIGTSQTFRDRAGRPVPILTEGSPNSRSGVTISSMIGWAGKNRLTYHNRR